MYLYSHYQGNPAVQQHVARAQAQAAREWAAREQADQAQAAAAQAQAASRAARRRNYVYIPEPEGMRPAYYITGPAPGPPPPPQAAYEHPANAQVQAPQLRPEDRVQLEWLCDKPTKAKHRKM